MAWVFDRSRVHDQEKVVICLPPECRLAPERLQDRTEVLAHAASAQQNEAAAQSFRGWVSEGQQIVSQSDGQRRGAPAEPPTRLFCLIKSPEPCTRPTSAPQLRLWDGFVFG
jgi:hypothetical protein